MFCPQCRSECAVDAKFCHNCGAGLPVTSAVPPSERTPAQETPVASSVGAINSGEKAYPWGSVMKWAAAGFVAGALIVDAPRHTPGLANMIAFKLVAGLAWAFVFGVGAAVYRFFRRS